MCSCRLLRSFVATGLLLLLMLWASSAPVVQADCPGGVPANAGFEGGFSERGTGEIVVANGWTPWWQDGPFQDDGLNRRPEFKPESSARFGDLRVREGGFAQKWGNTYATHHAGIFQQINVPATSMVTLRAWGQSWSSQEDKPEVSSKGKYFLSVGIDPTGGVDFGSPNIVWSPRSDTLDQWVELTVQARAQADTVTVYLRGDAEWRNKHNDAYFDDVCVTYEAPEPKATNTPRDTNTPRPTGTPTKTPTMTPSPTLPATPTPASGSIYAFAFDDRNDNGIRDADEGLLAGAYFELTNMQRTPIAAHATDGSADLRGFRDLKPGHYIVTEKDPPGYESILPNQWAASVLENTVLELFFADRVKPPPTSTPTPEPTIAAPEPTATATQRLAKSTTPVPTATAPATATPEPPEDQPTRTLGQRLYGISGILIAAVALLLPFALRALRSRL